MEPLPCDPSKLPKYPPSKELDAKVRDEEARRYALQKCLFFHIYICIIYQGYLYIYICILHFNFRRKAEAVRGRGPESVRRGSRDLDAVRTPEFIAPGQSKKASISHKFNNQNDSVSGFRIEPPRGAAQNRYAQSSTVVHPSASWNKNASSTRNNHELRTQRSHLPQQPADFSNNQKKEDRIFIREPMVKN